ncbi:hypothetical protein DRO30_02450 [Candidatus Bathyarchaeota archaeon]|nr:MAG: hypothetical protein DRO30_02450 [Candidatus Bathyarchaeota archaeon]
MLGRVEAEVETLPFHDRVEAKKLLIKFKEDSDYKALIGVLKILMRYGFKLNKEELKMLIEDVIKFLVLNNRKE